MIEEEFMVAFTLEDYHTLETKMDTRYVKFFAEYSQMINGVRERKEIGLHPCTEEEYARFYPVERNTAPLVEKYKTIANRTLFCLDLNSQDFKLFGTL